MIYWLILILELAILFFTSRFIFNTIFAIFMKIFKNQNIAIVPIFILFLPGVIIHELAHFLAAELLFVRAHDLEVAPHLSNGSIQMGSVKISETDIVRRMIIGVAPVILGSSFLLAVLFYFVNNINVATGFLVVWISFFITNTMFSSKKDVEGAVEFLGFIAFSTLVITIFSALIKINLLSPVIIFISEEFIVERVQLIAKLFLIPLSINLALTLLGKVIIKNSR